jgi:hypothetical protein
MSLLLHPPHYDYRPKHKQLDTYDDRLLKILQADAQTHCLGIIAAPHPDEPAYDLLYSVSKTAEGMTIDRVGRQRVLRERENELLSAAINEDYLARREKLRALLLVE